mgnify:CR=1 FL=1
MRKISCLKIGVVLAILTHACASNEKFIIEKSKLETPSWAQLESDRLVKKGKEVIFVYRGDEELSVSDGIKKSELEAVRRFREKTVSLLERQLGNLTVGLEESDRSSVKALLSKSIDRNFISNDLISDMYYEKVLPEGSSDSKGVYQIYILCHIDHNRIVEAVRSFKFSLVKARSTQLRALAAKIQESVL